MSLPNRRLNNSSHLNPSTKQQQPYKPLKGKTSTLEQLCKMANHKNLLLRFKFDPANEKITKLGQCHLSNKGSQHRKAQHNNSSKERMHYLKTDGDVQVKNDRQQTYGDDYYEQDEDDQEEEQKIIQFLADEAKKHFEIASQNQSADHSCNSKSHENHRRRISEHNVLAVQPSSTKHSLQKNSKVVIASSKHPRQSVSDSGSNNVAVGDETSGPRDNSKRENFAFRGNSIRHIKQQLSNTNTRNIGLINPYAISHISMKQSKKHSLKDELVFNHSVQLYANPSLNHTRKGSLGQANHNNSTDKAVSNPRQTKQVSTHNRSVNNSNQSPYRIKSKDSSSNPFDRNKDGRSNLFLDQQKNKRYNPYLRNAMGRRGSQTGHSRSQEKSKPHNNKSTHMKTQQSVQGADQINNSYNVINKPIKSKEILTLHLSVLTRYQQAEILDYQTVYYLNKKGSKERSGQDNNGFDDKKGQYVWQMHQHIAYRYEIVQDLGKGSFGQVFKAFDHKAKQFVALKIIRNKKTPNSQAKIQYSLLKYLRDADEYGCVNICMTFEMLSHNLYELIKLNKFLPLSGQLVRRLSIQILSTLLFLLKHNIIHCDIKPENILLKNSEKSGIKLIDFGSSCFADQKLYTYIQSRYYRAPEVILGFDYSSEIDMWSFGCVAAQLKLSYPIFSGEDEEEQVALITEVIGRPSADFYEATERGSQHFGPNAQPLKDRDGMIIEQGSRKLTNLFSDPDFADFLQRIFVWDPRKRLTPLEALRHKWILKGLPQEIREQHMDFLAQQQLSLKQIVKKRAQQNSKLSKQTGGHSMSEELLAKAMQSLS